MEDEITTGQTGATVTDGTGQAGGQSQEPAVTTGEPEGAQSVKEPSREGLAEGKGLEIERQYKELQREFTKRTQADSELKKQFEHFGGVDNVLKWSAWAQNNPRFAQFISEEIKRNDLGVNPSEMDDDTRKAYETVAAIAEKIADRKLAQMYSEKVEPLAASYKNKTINEHFSDMDKKYTGWREYQDVMYELAEELPERVGDNPTFGDIEDLYWKAVRKSGKMDAVAAGIYEKKLQEKKQKSTEKPAPVGPGSFTKPKNIREAFLQAKQAQGT